MAAFAIPIQCPCRLVLFSYFVSLSRMSRTVEKSFYSSFLLGIPVFLDSGRKCWTLDSRRWTLDPGRYTLDAGLWTLDTGHCR